MKHTKLFLFFGLLLSFVACKNTSSSEELYALIARYENSKVFDSNSEASLEITIAHYAAAARLSKELKIELEALSMDNVLETDKISYQLLLFVLQDKIDQHAFKMYLNPITNETAFHLNLSQMGQRELKSSKEAKAYLTELENLPTQIDYHLSILKAGVEAGISQPQAVFYEYDKTYNNHIVEAVTESAFYRPFLNLPVGFSASFKDSIISVAKASVQNNCIKQYKKIKTFFETEYFPNTRKEIGVSSVPNGKEFYQNRINFYTTSKKYTAEDIHNIGLEEVARIKLDMMKIITELNFKGSFADFLKFLRTAPQFYPKTAEELLMFARDVSKRIDAELPKFFKTLPRKPYGVVPVPAAIAPNYTSGRYSVSENETTAGFYWVNTYNLPSRTLYTIPALTAHEAVPGHHLQISLNNELPKTIPVFRRELYLSAFGEGWGLYAETLAAEMGIYTTPYEKFGKLTYEMWRACRLVVDTGVHALGWTRQQVLEYMTSNTALSLHEVRTETDRYISWPGQALSYKIGEIKIRQLRAEAEKALGIAFDIRDFHEVILNEGTVTLSILEKRVQRYIAKKKDE